MATHIYYPRANLIIEREVSASVLQELIIGVQPNAIFFLDQTGSLNQITASNLIVFSASWASGSVSASYAVTTSFSTTSSYSLNAGNTATYTSSLFGTASWADSSSYAITASFALNGGGSGTSLTTASTYPITSSWAITASFSLSGVGGSGTTLTTASTYPITASQAVTASFIISSSYSVSSSYAPTGAPTFTGKTDNYLPKWSSNTLTATSRIFDDGALVGIGTTIPSQSLHVLRTAAASYLRIEGISDDENFAGLELWDTSSTYKWQIALKSSASVVGDFQFTHFNSAYGWSYPFVIRTATDGINKIGVGKRTPSEVLDVNGNVKATSFIGTSSWATTAVGSVSATSASYASASTTSSYVQYARPQVLVSTMTDQAILQTDGNIAEHFRATLGGNRTLARATASYDGQRLSWEFIQDGGGTRTITLGTGYTTGSDFSVQLNQTASKRDFMTAIANGTSTTATWYVVGFVKGY